ncbi:MAG: hypothetical protein AUJ92_09250 [Armatimonadetes bacterium CG2_30_59_28]|nr:hypothetical protein [Armatimonadota bacterium]OIO94811.1 MAG: hypothetical protein AUJ92_09250 [Armatimonadetes bacterium CG2_30_59_28]PIU66005.1 MAG: resolvase [Armatimonadetes bacterium CG07_land_8_20_14_0_80_59_28]PIX45265.1 MAG: resolvase [Armatimonadetes bacterium CG_4_8_14_3_um_filter_58_9]PIY48179.1 MAG: resolvase [Armatimonadetes bacterium CG_4_10_14_3_um_filter_59_10]
MISGNEKTNRACVLAIDPGSSKCGVAMVAEDGAVILRRVLPRAELSGFVRHVRSNYDLQSIVVGDGTRSRQVAEELVQDGVPRASLRFTDEKNSTLEARARHFDENPPRGWRRLVPRGLLTPDEEYDDYVAVILAERYLRCHRQDEAALP